MKPTRPTPIRALTLTQPWAQLVADGRKRYETRSWKPSVPTPFTLAIHAAKGWNVEDQELAAEFGYDPASLPRAAIVAVVRVRLVVATAVVRETLSADEIRFGDFSDGRYAWELDNLRTVGPFEARGALGIWRWDPGPPR